MTDSIQTHRQILHSIGGDIPNIYQRINNHHSTCWNINVYLYLHGGEFKKSLLHIGAFIKVLFFFVFFILNHIIWIITLTPKWD